MNLMLGLPLAITLGLLFCVVSLPIVYARHVENYVLYRSVAQDHCAVRWKHTCKPTGWWVGQYQCYTVYWCEPRSRYVSETYSAERCQSGWTTYPYCNTHIDECTSGTSNCSQLCVNGIGNYTCDCLPGYSLAEDERTCNDVNECSISSAGCAQLCNNSIGSYTCGCSQGYSLAQNGKSCSDVDECAANISVCSQLCNNSIGSYTCGCNSCYNLALDGKSCVGIEVPVER